MFDGQSLNLAPADSKAMPMRAMALITPRTYSIVGIQGTTYADRAATVAGRVDREVINSTRPVYVDIAGTSDILAGMTAAAILTAAEANADARRAAGFTKAIIATVPAATAAWGWTAPIETQRLAYNDLLRASAAFDAYIDLAAIPEWADPANLTYFSDGAHPTAAGADLGAPVLAAAFGTVGIT